MFDDFLYFLFIRDKFTRTISLELNVNSVKIVGGAFFLTIRSGQISESKELMLMNMKEIYATIYLSKNSETIGCVELEYAPKSVIKLDTGKIMLCMRPIWI